MVKNPPADAGDTKDSGSIPGLGRYLGRRNGNPLQYSSWEIPWTEEPSGLRSMGSQRVKTRLSNNNSKELDKYWLIKCASLRLILKKKKSCGSLSLLSLSLAQCYRPSHYNLMFPLWIL